MFPRVAAPQARVARSRRALYEGADGEAVVALLTHKVVKAARLEGLDEARMMLTDWLVFLAARLSEAYAQQSAGARSADRRPTSAFADCPALQARSGPLGLRQAPRSLPPLTSVGLPPSAAACPVLG